MSESSFDVSRGTAAPRRAVRPAAVLAAACAGMAAIGLALNVPAICLTSMAADLGLDIGQKGILLSFPGWGLVAMLLVVGPLADRLGCRVFLVASAFCQAGGLIVVSLADSLGVACAGAVLVGAGVGMCDALTTPLVCAAYSDSRNRATNFLHAFFAVGILVVVALCLLAFQLGLSWRWAYRLTALLCLPYGLAFALLPLPGQIHLSPQRTGARKLLTKGTFWLLIGGMLAAGLSEIGPALWLPTYIEQAGGGSRLSGAIGLLLLGTGMMVGRLGNSLLARRLSSVRLYMTGAAICAISLLTAALYHQPVVIIVCFTLLGLGVSGLWPTGLSMAGDRFPQAGASMFALLSAVGNFGGIVGPMAVGFIAEGHGLPVAMAVMTLAPLGGVALAVCLWRLGRPRG